MLPCSAPTPLLLFSRQAKFACVQRQKPAMFAQMPLCVYRHFTGAVCTTSSDGRFKGMTAFTGLSSSLTGSPFIWQFRLLVASTPVRDLLLCAEHLFVEATQARLCWLWLSLTGRCDCLWTGVFCGSPCLAPANKCSAQSNKSQDVGNATKK
jgi:hypothetical protein